MADAAALIVQGNKSGQFFLDDQVLLDAGVSVEKINSYAVVSPSELAPDFFLDGVEEHLAELARGRVPRAKL